MARPVNLPSDRGVSRTDLVVARSACGGSSVISNVCSEMLCFKDHAPHQVWVVIVLIIHDGEDLCLHTNQLVNIQVKVPVVTGSSQRDAWPALTRVSAWVAKDTIIEGNWYCHGVPHAPIPE